MVNSAYVHVPFCAKKCEYCAFYSEGTDGAKIERYANALVSEIRSHQGHPQPKTIFFGGGTPTLLNLSQWRRVFDALREIEWATPAEFTIEGNPATISAAKADLFLANGVNRFSMGVQSLNADLLVRLGRVHSREMVFRSYEILRQAGFNNVNLDLMFAIPGQTMAIWEQTLEEILGLGSEHLSCYEVIYEQDTPLYEQLQAGEFDVDEALACSMYEKLMDRVTGEGFQQYEIANFARSDGAEPDSIPTRACRHNVNYWTGGEYFGLGPAAAGHVGGLRYQNWSNTELYCDAIESKRLPRDGGEKLSPEAKASETAAFWLRMNQGIQFSEFTERTGYRLEEGWPEELDHLVSQGWAERTSDRIRLTRRGLRFADAAGAELLRT